MGITFSADNNYALGNKVHEIISILELHALRLHACFGELNLVQIARKEAKNYVKISRGI